MPSVQPTPRQGGKSRVAEPASARAFLVWMTLVQGAVSQLQAGAPWPAWGVSMAHSGDNAGTLTRESSLTWGAGEWGMQKSWSYLTSAPIQTSVAIGPEGRTVFFATEGGSFFGMQSFSGYGYQWPNPGPSALTRGRGVQRIRFRPRLTSFPSLPSRPAIYNVLISGSQL